LSEEFVSDSDEGDFGAFALVFESDVKFFASLVAPAGGECRHVEYLSDGWVSPSGDAAPESDRLAGLLGVGGEADELGGLLGAGEALEPVGGQEYLAGRGGADAGDGL
jgi:hypothetical protein